MCVVDVWTRVGSTPNIPHLRDIAVTTPHADPFDRLLLAQCEVETLKLLTADKTLRKLPGALP